MCSQACFFKQPAEACFGVERRGTVGSSKSSGLSFMPLLTVFAERFNSEMQMAVNCLTRNPHHTDKCMSLLCFGLVQSLLSSALSKGVMPIFVAN